MYFKMHLIYLNADHAEESLEVLILVWKMKAKENLYIKPWFLVNRPQTKLKIQLLACDFQSLQKNNSASFFFFFPMCCLVAPKVLKALCIFESHLFIQLAFIGHLLGAKLWVNKAHMYYLFYPPRKRTPGLQLPPSSIAEILFALIKAVPILTQFKDNSVQR